MDPASAGSGAQERLRQSRLDIRQLLDEGEGARSGEFPRSLTMRVLCHGVGRRLASTATMALLMKIARSLLHSGER